MWVDGMRMPAAGLESAIGFLLLLVTPGRGFLKTAMVIPESSRCRPDWLYCWHIAYGMAAAAPTQSESN